MFASEETHVDYLEAPFLARLTSLVAGTGAQSGLNLYGFTEQVFDPATGFPADASPARTGNPSSTGDTYALEAGNQSITVPGSTPSGYTNPGPYVWLRLKGIVNGIPVYEFDAGQTAGSGVSFSGARYYGDGLTQSIPNNAFTTVSFNGTHDYDTDSYTKAFNVPVKGYYRGYFQIIFPSASVSYLAGVAALGSDSTQYGQVNTYAPSGMSIQVQCAFEGHFATGIHLLCQVFQNSGTTLAITPRLEVISIILIPAGTLSSEGL